MSKNIRLKQFAAAVIALAATGATLAIPGLSDRQVSTAIRATSTPRDRNHRYGERRSMRGSERARRPETQGKGSDPGGFHYLEQVEAQHLGRPVYTSDDLATIKRLLRAMTEAALDDRITGDDP